MLRRTTLTAARRAARSFSDAAAAAQEMVRLTFSLPYENIYKNTPVSSVILPGTEGEYGITAGHVPYVAKLQPGVMQILHDATSEPEKYFIAGGFALTHSDSSTVRYILVIVCILQLTMNF